MSIMVQRIIGREAAKGFRRRESIGFWKRYGAPTFLDIGYRGDIAGAQPVLPGATGIELGDPGYDGRHLPFENEAFRTVHACHVLEHVQCEPWEAVWEWFRVVCHTGHLILIVPHAFLYERRLTVPPSRWSPEHMVAFTPASLLKVIEHALEPNTYRIRHMCDVDAGYRYDLPVTTHPEGSYEIECVIQRIASPPWTVEP